jgi:hypothetical protein
LKLIDSATLTTLDSFPCRFCSIHLHPHAGAANLLNMRHHFTLCVSQGGIFHDGSDRAEALDTCLATWSVLSMNYSKERSHADLARSQAIAPIFAGIFQAFVDALLLHAKVRWPQRCSAGVAVAHSLRAG